MPTPVSEAARNVAEHASSVAKLELRLATLELKKKASSIAIGIGLGAAAALLALLIVTVGLLLLSGLLGFLALRAVKKGSPPVPEQAIQEARLTSAAIKS